MHTRHRCPGRCPLSKGQVSTETRLLLFFFYLRQSQTLRNWQKNIWPIRDNYFRRFTSQISSWIILVQRLSQRLSHNDSVSWSFGGRTEKARLFIFKIIIIIKLLPQRLAFRRPNTRGCHSVPLACLYSLPLLGFTKGRVLCGISLSSSLRCVLCWSRLISVWLWL